ncbi:hypothetical protein C8K30_11622 [Promicromonospora sp. AC04]|nr:hypothetical protein C8K30_11622 [Promicromonospora sp. AC04]
MGLLGQQAHPDVTAAVRKTFEAVRTAGKPVGVNAFDPSGRGQRSRPKKVRMSSINRSGASCAAKWLPVP